MTELTDIFGPSTKDREAACFDFYSELGAAKPITGYQIARDMQCREILGVPQRNEEAVYTYIQYGFSVAAFGALFLITFLLLTRLRQTGRAISLMEKELEALK